MKFLIQIQVLLLAIAILFLPGCANLDMRNWTPEKRQAFRTAAFNEALTIGLDALSQYSNNGDVSAKQTAFDGISGSAELLRALEMPNLPANQQPGKADLNRAIVQGTGGNPALASKLLPVVTAILSDKNKGVPVATSIESHAKGFDAAAVIASKGV